VSADRVGDVFWNKVSGDLQGVALSWWREHTNDLTEFSREEATEIFNELREGRTMDAKLVLVSRMTRQEWVAYRDGTTELLDAIASRRARMFEALSDLGFRAAKAIGEAALSAL
jgi:hypothetical protein